MLLRTDPETHRLSYLSIPRDLRVEIPGLRLGEDQLGQPVRRAGAHARHGPQPHRPSDQPRHRRRLRRLQGPHRRARRHRHHRAEADPLEQVRLPVPARAVLELEGLAVRQGPAAHGRTTRARLLAHPHEPARPVRDRRHENSAPAGGRRRGRGQDRELRDVHQAAVHGRLARVTARNRSLGVAARSARLGSVPRRQVAALPPGRRAADDRRRVRDRGGRGQRQRDPDVHSAAPRRSRRGRASRTRPAVRGPR